MTYRQLCDLESYFVIVIDGQHYLARIRIDMPGKTWVHRGCLWTLLT